MRVIFAALLIVASLLMGVTLRVWPESNSIEGYRPVLEAYVDRAAGARNLELQYDQSQQELTAAQRDIEILGRQLEDLHTKRFTERPSPADHVLQEQIKSTGEGVFIDVANTRTWYALGTHSMDPLMGAGTSVITIPPSEHDLAIGDIIVFTWNISEYKVVHRIVDIAEDEAGTYYITKGDNNPDVDDITLRIDDIEAVVVAVVY